MTQVLQSESLRRVCVICGNAFTMTEEQAHWFTHRGWQLPKRCEMCRQTAASHQAEGGVLKTWFDAGEYGFIQTDAGDSIFTHKKFFDAANTPVNLLGARVAFRRKWDREGRPQAVNVRNAPEWDTGE